MVKSPARRRATRKRIRPSVVEFLLRPRTRSTRRASGGDVRPRKCAFDTGWQRPDNGPDVAGKNTKESLEYPIYAPPAAGRTAGETPDRVTPSWKMRRCKDYPSIQRGRLSNGRRHVAMLAPGVTEYIRRKGSWSPANRMTALHTAPRRRPGKHAALLLERGQLHYRMNQWGAASPQRLQRDTAINPGTKKPGNSSKWWKKYWHSDTKTFTTHDRETQHSASGGGDRRNGKLRRKAQPRLRRRSTRRNRRGR